MEILNKEIKNILYGLIVVGMMAGTNACNNDRPNDASHRANTQMGEESLENDAEVIDNDESAWIQERDDFVTTNRELSTKIEREIAQKEREMEKLSGKSRDAMQESINSLKIKRENLDTKLENLGQASHESWQKMKNEVSEASTELEKTWEAFEKEHKTHGNK